jgi:tRNA (guanosine-2'-O-)-methyltransferase
MRSEGWRIVAVGLADGGIPARWVEDADDCMEIPMVGRGASLNAAVAGSLVLYRLAGLS